jgi:hypothetical protein
MIDTDDKEEPIPTPKGKIIIDINDTVEVMKTKAMEYLKDQFRALNDDHNAGHMTKEKYVDELIRVNRRFLEVDRVIIF